MAHQWSWKFRLILAFVLQPCRSELLELNGFSTTDSRPIDNDPTSSKLVKAGCTSGYFEFENSCYKLSSTYITRYDASNICKNDGSHLVDITSQAEQDFLAGRLSTYSASDVWIGLSSDSYSNPQTWSDGSALDFTAWTGNGARTNGENCVRMSPYSNYEWNDRSCNTNYQYVCEFEQSWTVNLQESTCVQGVYLTTDITCSLGTCSLKVDNTACFTYTGSNDYATHTLVPCDNVICGTTVQLVCPANSCYVNLKEIDLDVTTTANPVEEEVPVYYTESVPLQYADCAEVQAANPSAAYTFFCSDATYIGYKSCAEILQAGHQETGYYEIDPDGAEPGVNGFLVFCDLCDATGGGGECPDGYLTFDNSCYKVSTGSSSWSDASSACAAMDPVSHLAYIKSQEEQDFIAAQLSDEVWIGLRKTSGTFSWLDGSSDDFNAWSSSVGNNDYVRMDNDYGYRWRTGRDSWNKQYLCEFELNPTSGTGDCRGTTVIDHEQPRTDTPDSKNKPGEFKVPISYKPSLSQISALIAVSESCQQYIKYDCYNSFVWNNDWPYVWWKSRHGKDMHNFGGVSTGQEGCACNLTTQGCTTSGTKCNCDTADDNWYLDDGLLTDKNTLPVTELRFGGNDASQYTLAPLQCNGIGAPPKKSCYELWLSGERTDMEYEIDPDGADGLGPAFTVFCNLSQAAAILRSCEELRLAGYNTDGYYDIDPDDPDFGEPPFTVFCNMTTGETVIEHDSESKGRVKGYHHKGDFVLTPNYLASSAEQMYRLIGVSETCKQYIQYDCYKSKMYKNAAETDVEAWWSTKDGGVMLNWGDVETGKFGCSCYTNTETVCAKPDRVCNCDMDDEIWRNDGGWLNDKDSLPVFNVYHSHTENEIRAGWHTLGHLQCYGLKNDLPLYRTCAELQRAGHVRNGSYLLDSDGADAGDTPFPAYCDMTNGETYIFHDTPESTSVKQSTAYSHVVNYQPSTNQLKELASLSVECSQRLQFNCKDFPLWDNDLGVMKGWWVNVDGQKMNNWAGKALEEVGCACDSAQCPDGYLTFDNSCYKISTDASSWSDASSACAAMNPESHLAYIKSQEEQDFIAGKLSDDVWIGLRKTSGTFSWLDGSSDDFKAWASSVGSLDYVRMDDGYGYKWRTGDNSWPKQYVCEFEFTVGCHTPSHMCNCDSEDGITRSDEGPITDKQFLPVSELHFDANTNPNSEGLVTLGAFQCQGIDTPIHASCDELHSAGFNSSGWYEIDPDGPGSPLTPITVHCDMITGATVIHHDSEARRLAISELDVAPDEASFRQFVTYKAPMSHIEALLQSSLYCKQFIRWDCHSAPIWDNNDQQLTYWLSRDGEQMVNWDGNTGIQGCLCGTSNACDAGSQYKCNCDADDDVWRYDEGFLVDSNKLPVSEVRFGGINHYLAIGFYTLGPLQCFGKSDSIPVLESCASLRDAGHTTNGYYYIDPDGFNNGVDSFSVYCDMSTGNTIIGHDRDDRGLIRDSAFDTLMVEYDATFDQIEALISISPHCQQELTYDCYGSRLWNTMSNPYGHVGFWRSPTGGGFRYNFGIGTGLQGCPCSLDGSCANPDRYCNCDTDDYTWRTDSGTVTHKATLPVAKIQFGDTNEDKEKGFYTLGKLECSDREFSSCDELKTAGYVTDGFYEIYPDGMVFCNMSQACPVYRTGRVFRYQYRFPEIPDYVSSIEFSVKAAFNAYIALTNEPNVVRAGFVLYEIGIGTGNNNSNAVIRSCVQNTACNEVTAEVPNPLSEVQHREFYINFQNGRIQVGRMGEAPLVEFVDETPSPIKYVGFTTTASEGEWEFPQWCSGFSKYGGIRYNQLTDNLYYDKLIL